MENYGFLKEKYGLHNSEEVESAKDRTETRTSETVENNPNALIGNYLNRFKEIIDRTDPYKRERGMDALKKVMHDQFVIKPEEIPESAFLLEQRIARELGHGDVEITDEFKDRKTEQIINNQTQSLDKWIDYLSSADAQYPDWAKYWAFRSMTQMGKLQKEESVDGKENARFQKRTPDTIASFPPLNPRALAMTIGVLRSRLEEKLKPKEERQPVENVSTKLNDQEFQSLLSTEAFSKLYAQFLIEMPEYSAEGLQNIEGQWVKYEQGNDAHQLVQSLEGYPLEWCTADYDTAQTQLEGGDFYVYYSMNENGEAIIPRLAIRMQEGKIAEDPRGIAANQNLDPYITPVLEDKLKDFGQQGEIYKKKSQDMKCLTEIDYKAQQGKQLDKEDLVFLYQINGSIEGFGYQEDPRIAELLEGRDKMADAAIVFECEPAEIAQSISQIKDNTKAYIGEWNPAVMKLLPENIQYLYESFPEKKIFRKSIELSAKTPQEYEQELLKTGNKISSYAKSMLDKMKASPTFEQIDLVQFSVEQLGFARWASLQKIFDQAKELGLELCPPQTGPELRLSYTDQPNDEYLRIAMNPISDSDGSPLLFDVSRRVSEPWLLGGGGDLDDRWSGDDEFVFRVRK